MPVNWFSGIDLRIFFRDLGILALIFLFWWFPLLYPLQLLSTFFHEVGHALGAVLTGGTVIRVEIAPDTSGLCIASADCDTFIFCSAGYLGSVIFGGVLLVLTRKRSWAPWVASFIGLLMIGVALLWIRPLGGFGFTYAVVFGMFWLLVAVLFRHQRKLHLALHFVSLVICFDAVLSTMATTIPHLETDAVILGRETNTPPMLWAIIWTTASFTMGLLFLLMASSDSFERKKRAE